MTNDVKGITVFVLDSLNWKHDESCTCIELFIYLWHQFVKGRHIKYCSDICSVLAPMISTRNYGLLFGSFGSSTKEPDTIMLCSSCVVDIIIIVGCYLCTLTHRVRHRNFIFGLNMPTCAWYTQIKYLVILTYSF